MEKLTETRIVWLEDVARLDYVRSTTFLVRTAKGWPAVRTSGRVVGYAEVARTASGWVPRRVFWLSR